MFTKEARQEIIKQHVAEHGEWNPRKFVEVVREAGEDHPAYEWFKWNESAAAFEYWVVQAREFSRGLKIRFEIRQGPKKAMTIKYSEAPMLLSPIQTRDEGGYYLFNPQNPEHMDELCQQASLALDAWLERYSAAIDYAGISETSIAQIIEVLKNRKAKAA